MVLSINELANSGIFSCSAKKIQSAGDFCAVFENVENSYDDTSFFSRNTDYDRKINTYEDFIKYYNYVRPNARAGLKSGTYMNGAMHNIDFKREYNMYLEERGCKSSLELAALNKTDCYTVDELKKFSEGKICEMLSSIKDEKLYLGDINYDCAYIMRKTSLSDLADFYNDCAHPKEERSALEIARDNLKNMEAFKKLLGKLPEDILKKLNLNDLNEAVDKMLEILKKRVVEERQKELEKLRKREDAEEKEELKNLPDEKSNGQIVIDLR